MSFINVLKEKLEAQQIYDGLKGKYESHFVVNGVQYALLATSVGGDVQDNTQWYLEFENCQSHRIGVGDNDKDVAKAMGEAVKQWVETTAPHCFFTYGSSIDSIKNIIDAIKKSVKKYNVIDDTADRKDETDDVIPGNPIGKITWTKMEEAEDSTAEEKSNTKSIEFEKTFEEPKDLKTTKDFTTGTSKTDKLDKGDKAYDVKTESTWQEFKNKNIIESKASKAINNPNYKYYVVGNGKIHSGWEYLEDAQDDQKEIAEDGITTKILQRLGLKKLSLNPDNDADWGSVYNK